MNYIAYYRVSTQKQGRSGLGLEAQQHAVRRYLKQDDALLQEYIEVEFWQTQRPAPAGTGHRACAAGRVQTTDCQTGPA